MGVDMINDRRLLGALAVVLVTIAASCTAPPSQTPQQQVDAIISFVESARGHAFVTHPAVVFEADAVFRQHVLDSIAASQADVDRAEPAFHALGWLAPTDSLYQKFQITFGGTVVGFYDPATKVLEVRGSDLTPYRREVIAHELTHALDDQLFDLGGDFGDGFLGERSFAARVAIEGDAVRVQQAYYGSMSGIDQAQDIAEQLSFPVDPALLTVPLTLLTFTQVPYLRGGTLVNEVSGALGTPAGPDQLMSRYPVTAEQAFDTSKYLADEPAAPVAPPPADGPVVESGSWGQYLLSEIIGEGSALTSVAPATVGWAGDSYVTWHGSGVDCIRLDTRMDTVDQAVVLRSSLDNWSTIHAGAAITSVDDHTVRLSSCA